MMLGSMHNARQPNAGPRCGFRSCLIHAGPLANRDARESVPSVALGVSDTAFILQPPLLGCYWQRHRALRTRIPEKGILDCGVEQPSTNRCTRDAPDLDDSATTRETRPCARQRTRKPERCARLTGGARAGAVEEAVQPTRDGRANRSATEACRPR